jgi:hypothetical protein
MKKGIWLVAVMAASAFAYTVQIDTADVRVAPAEDPAFLGYDVVRLEGGGALPVDPGKPALPAIPVTVALPPGTEIASVDVSYGEPVALPGTYRVMPTQEPTPWSSEKGIATAADAEAYASSEAFPGKLAYSFESGNMGGYGVGSVLIAPVQYVPATGKLLVYPVIDFDVRLRRAAGELAYPGVRLEWIDRGIREGLAATVVNPWEIRRAGGVRLISGRDEGEGRRPGGLEDQERPQRNGRYHRGHRDRLHRPRHGREDPQLHQGLLREQRHAVRLPLRLGLRYPGAQGLRPAVQRGRGGLPDPDG